MPAALFIVLAVIVVVATAVALAGGWQPQGLGAQAPQDPGQTRFDVVLRGYRMDQVDAEMQRLHDLLEQAQEQAPAPAQAPGEAVAP